jgi:hypothetical protein
MDHLILATVPGIIWLVMVLVLLGAVTVLIQFCVLCFADLVLEL